MTDHDRRDWIDALSARYLDALDRDDFDAQEELWALAAQHADLETAFRELHEGLLEEEAAKATAAVTDAVESHLKSATIVREPTGPVTFADVADELFRHTPGGLPPEAHALNAKLREAKEPLPADLGLSGLIAFAEAKFGAASRDYWRAFREAALTVRMRANSQSAEYQLAARRAPKPEDRP
ncbi:hypothetical protein [Limnoglobus roseus]|uniref:Uncharacterized protein n=1 Tax=Limnoglobus roseus TaxID=2598579 RepID=A0A5C1AE30_9BACT|nr:hypothetical protein [Limnoglobus roseus]QEL15338.1 hypothetical protein PX52LOC_02253 [Limnoglobus roseus]